MSDNRAEQALRSALAAPEIPPTPDPRTIRRRLRDRRLGIAALASALILLVSVAAFITADRGLNQQQVVAIPSGAARLPDDPAPEGWRTEYYHGISFQVPQMWGYAFEPGPDWCADAPDGKPDRQHQEPYVALGRPEASHAIGCTDPPPSLTTEHVLVTKLASNVRYQQRWDREEAGWWVVGRVTGATVLSVTSKDRALARRIAGSVQETTGAAPCNAEHDLVQDRPVRPTPAFDLSKAIEPGRLVVCQYQATAGSNGLGLRAVLWFDADKAAMILRSIRETPIMHPEPCARPTAREIALVIRFEAGGQLREVYVQAGGCAAGAAGYGGFDDGTNVRGLTKDNCRPVMVPPVQLSTATRYVGDACLG